jgi:organic hydroperoxide reductase OsmC/OhrA
MSIVKTIHVPVSAEWSGGSFVNVEAPGKSALRVTKPAEFGGPSGSFWSPEELLVNALASCYAITLEAFAERRQVPLRDLHLEALGHIERRRNGGWEFVFIQLDVVLTTDPGFEAAARSVCEIAEDRCIVGRALETPVDVRVVVRAATKEPVAA